MSIKRSCNLMGIDMSFNVLSIERSCNLMSTDRSCNVLSIERSCSVQIFSSLITYSISGQIYIFVY